VSLGAPEWLAVPAPHVTPIVLLLNDTNLIWYGNGVGNHYAPINTNNITYKTNGSRIEHRFYAEIVADITTLTLRTTQHIRPQELRVRYVIEGQHKHQFYVEKVVNATKSKQTHGT